ncbi:MAG: hypothetical protein JST16_16065 [Bdellovibrionales bacterium]|nr:hypothetical protein [Bdellovibrionales bacterium]
MKLVLLALSFISVASAQAAKFNPDSIQKVNCVSTPDADGLHMTGSRLTPKAPLIFDWSARNGDARIQMTYKTSQIQEVTKAQILRENQRRAKVGIQAVDASQFPDGAYLIRVTNVGGSYPGKSKMELLVSKSNGFTDVRGNSDQYRIAELLKCVVNPTAASSPAPVETEH